MINVLHHRHSNNYVARVFISAKIKQVYGKYCFCLCDTVNTKKERFHFLSREASFIAHIIFLYRSENNEDEYQTCLVVSLYLIKLHFANIEKMPRKNSLFTQIKTVI